jgi:hypothetical protein
VWLSIPLLLLSGVFTGPAVSALLALFGPYDLAIELNGLSSAEGPWISTQFSGQ